MKKAIVFTSLILGGLASPLAAAEVASFGNKKITEEDYKKAIEGLGPQAEMVKKNPRIRTQFLNHLIDSTLLSQEAEKAKLDETDRYKSMVSDAKRDILARLYVEKYIDEQSSEKNLKTYFEKNKKEFAGKEIKASHILLKEADKEQAEKLLKEALAGKDFAELAKKHSTGPSKGRGGDLGFFGRGRMVPEFEKAAFATAKGKVHPELVKTQFGWHIIKVDDVRGGDDVKFAEKKDEVIKTIKRNGRKDLVQQLREKANVKVNEEVVKKIKF